MATSTSRIKSPFVMVTHGGIDVSPNVVFFSYKYSQTADDVCQLRFRTNNVLIADEQWLQEGAKLKVSWGYRVYPGESVVDNMITRIVFVKEATFLYDREWVTVEIVCSDKFSYASKDSKNTVHNETSTGDLAKKIAEEHGLNLDDEHITTEIQGNVIEYTNEVITRKYPTYLDKDGYQKMAVDNTFVYMEGSHKTYAEWPQSNKSDKQTLQDMANNDKDGVTEVYGRDEDLVVRKRPFGKKPVRCYKYGISPNLLRFTPMRKSNTKNSKGETSGGVDPETKQPFTSTASSGTTFVEKITGNTVPTGNLVTQKTPSESPKPYHMPFPFNSITIEKYSFWGRAIDYKEGDSTHQKDSTSIYPVINTHTLPASSPMGETHTINQGGRTRLTANDSNFSANGDTVKVITQGGRTRLTAVPVAKGKTMKDKMEEYKKQKDASKQDTDNHFDLDGLIVVWRDLKKVDNSTGQPIWDSIRKGKYNTSDETNAQDAADKAANDQAKAAAEENPGDIEIEGDPLLTSGEMITILNVAKIHSGNWYIKECTHTIRGGGDANGYTCLCGIIRNATNQGNETPGTTTTPGSEQNVEPAKFDLQDKLKKIRAGDANKPFPLYNGAPNIPSDKILGQYPNSFILK